MAAVSVTTTPVTLDSGTAAELVIVNTGALAVHVVPPDLRIRPGQTLRVQTAGAAVTAYTESGSGTVDVVTVGSAFPDVRAAAATSLKRFRQALAAVDSVPASLLFIGDSITEGAGATTLDRSWMHLVRRALQKSYTVAGKGGFGFLNTSAKTGTGSPNPNLNGAGSGSCYWTFSGGAEAGSTGQTGGLLGLRRRPLAVNETATLTFVGTAVDLHYTLGSSSFTYTVDGGSAQSVTVGAGSAKTGKTSVTGLTSGTHTIVVTPVASGTLGLLGAYIFDGDETSGFRVLNDAQYGIHSGTVAAATGTGGSTYLTDPLTLWPNPALVVIALGTNDPANGVTPAQTAANLQTVIANVKAKCTITPSFLVVVPALTASNAAAATPWSQYVGAIKSVVSADSANVALLDLTVDFIDAPSAGNNQLQGLIATDNTHPKDAGHKLIGGRGTRVLVGDLVPV